MLKHKFIFNINFIFNKYFTFNEYFLNKTGN